MSKESLLSKIQIYWNQSLLKAYNIRGPNIYEWLQHHYNYSFDSNKDLFSDYTETIRLPDDNFVLEVHYDYEYIMLVHQTSHMERVVFKEEYSNSKSKAKAIEKALQAYFEEKIEMEKEQNYYGSL